MRLLILVDAANFRSSAGNLISNPRDLWYAALGNLIAVKVQARLNERLTDVELRLYLSRTDEQTTARFVRENLLTDRAAKRLVTDTRLIFNEVDPAFSLPGVRVVLRSFVPHKANWDTQRVRLPADTAHDTKNFVYVRHMASSVREKAADTMLAFDMAAAAATGECDVLVVCTEDTDQRPTLSAAGPLAKRGGHKVSVFNAIPGRADGRVSGVGARNCSQLRLLREDLEACAIFATKENRGNNAPTSYADEPIVAADDRTPDDARTAVAERPEGESPDEEAAG